MYARSTTVRGNPQAMDDAIAYMRDEVMPAIQELDGFVGLSMLCDRDMGRCIIATSWRTEEAMHASAERVRPQRNRLTEMLGGTPEVQEWEVALMHRVHEAPAGACTRLTWVRTEPGRPDRYLDEYRMTLIPRLEEMEGFCSCSLMMRRDEGIGASAVTFESRQALENSRERARELRDELVPRMGIAITDVEEYELVLAHLRVPETV
ncbi:MAG TPA: hypothetical protein VHF92_02165 [Geodermatophilus sp.]|nr:hypothetical protein [Geodermatophilus sp.]